MDNAARSNNGGARREIDAADASALRACALFCWQHRAKSVLCEPELEQTLIAWMAVGTADQGVAASDLLAALRAAEAALAKFSQLLNPPQS